MFVHKAMLGSGDPPVMASYVAVCQHLLHALPAPKRPALEGRMNALQEQYQVGHSLMFFPVVTVLLYL